MLSHRSKNSRAGSSHISKGRMSKLLLAACRLLSLFNLWKPLGSDERWLLLRDSLSRCIKRAISLGKLYNSFVSSISTFRFINFPTAGGTDNSLKSKHDSLLGLKSSISSSVIPNIASGKAFSSFPLIRSFFWPRNSGSVVSIRSLNSFIASLYRYMFLWRDIFYNFCPFCLLFRHVQYKYHMHVFSPHFYDLVYFNCISFLVSISVWNLELRINRT